MSYTVAPDVTTSSLAIDNAATANPGLTMTQLGGGFTWSKSTPLYLEGNAAYSRFLGSETEVGIDRMASAGVGIEFGSSAYDVWATRWRGMLRYRFGPDIAGWSVGLAVSF